MLDEPEVVKMCIYVCLIYNKSGPYLAGGGGGGSSPPPG